MRIACLRVADLPLAAALRAHPELRGHPLAITGGTGARAELVSVSPEAAARGVRRGASIAQARSLSADLALRVSSPALEAAARDALLDATFACTPRAEASPPASSSFAAEACVFADAGGCEALFGSEAGFAGALTARAAALGLPADATVASSRAVARIAARRLRLDGKLDGDAATSGEGATRVLPPGRERAFLQPLPLDLFDPGDALAETLTRFGVRSVGELLALPRRGLARRLGAEVLALLDLAAGRAVETPLPEPDEARLTEALDAEAPLDALPPLLFALRGLLARLLERLAARHLACAELDLALDLDGGARDARRIAAAAPSLDPRVWMRLVHRALEARPPGAAVLALRLETRALPLRGDQLDLFRPAGPAPAALGETLAALQGLCGADRVGAPISADSHHPDACGLAPFRPPQPAGAGTSITSHEASPRGGPTRVAGTCALRALRPPLPAQVELRGGQPARLRSAIANGRVLDCAGPWRSSGGWWSPEERFAFESFDVWTEDGLVVRLRYDGLRRHWEIDGVYD